MWRKCDFTMNNLLFRICFFILYFLICNLQSSICNLHSQPIQEWASRYQRTSGSPALKNYLSLDKLGGSYVCGTVFNSVTRNDIVLIKYNSLGDTVWIRRYNNNNNEDFPAGVVVDSIGNAYVTSTSGPGGNLNDFLTLKYSPTGILLWIRIYGYPGINEGANDIKMDRQGNNIYITGTNSNTGSAVTIKYNSIGDSQWVRTKGLSGYHYYGQNIAIDNNYAYTGIIRVNDNNNLDDFLVVKYDVNGNEQWTGMHVNNSGFDDIRGLVVDNSGNSYITGIFFNANNNNFITIKFNGFGAEQWAKMYNGTANNFDQPYAIAVDINNNIYVTGTSAGIGTSLDYLTIKYNPIGDSLWVNRYDGPGNSFDYSYAIALDDSANVYLTGSSIGSGTSRDYATLKYNTSGVQQWVVRYNNNP